MESSGDNDVLPSAMRWAQRTGEFQKAQLEDFKDMIQLCVPPKMKCSKSLHYYAHAPHRPTFNMHVNAPDLLAMVCPRRSRYTLFGDCSSRELFSGFWLSQNVSFLDFAGFNCIRTLQATSRADGKSMKAPLEALKKPDFMARKSLSNMSRAVLARRVLCPHEKKNVVPSQNFVKIRKEYNFCM